MPVFSAEKLLCLIDDLGGIVWEADPDPFRFSFVSAGAERILGFPVSAWLEPDFWLRQTHPDDVERCTRYCMDATREGRDHSFEYRMLAADGRVVWLRDIVSVLRDPTCGTSLVGISMDITALKDEEAEKFRLARLYEALLENSCDNIGLIGADGVAVYQSAAVEQQLGYRPEEVVGGNNFDWVHPDDDALVRQRFAEVLESDRTVGPIRFRCRHKEGRWCILEAVAKRFVAEGGATFVVANTRDVTREIATQEALAAAREQLAQAMKMEAVGRLAGGVAHDFNNLLTVIAGYADLLGATFTPSDRRLADVDEIRRAAQRASLLTRQLLAFSRKQVLRPEVLDLNVVLGETAVLIRRLIGEDVQLDVETAPERLPVRADRSQIEQVLMNLAVNARDAMPLGGRLSMRVASSSESAHLIVADNGSGMPPEVVARVFEPFFTTKDVGAGTGLGLATVYGIIQQSGGDVQVESAVGEGTVFSIRLPLAADSSRAGEDVPGAVPGGAETILLVEDERQVREFAEQVLGRLGYTVLAAADGPAARALCAAHSERIALLLTDVVMPDLSGPDVYAEVSRTVPDVAVLYMSGYMGERLFARGVQADGIAFLQKPFTPAELGRRVRQVLDEAQGRRAR